jgi:YfiH family protein
MSEVIRPDWSAPANVQALVTTKRFGDMAHEGRERLRAMLPSEPAWLKQVHGTTVVELDGELAHREADAAVTRLRGPVCAVQAADCMPVLLCDADGRAVGAAHAGWRGLCAGVIEAAVRKMRIPGQDLLAWLGPAIGPKVYEVGEEVRLAFIAKDPGARAAFTPNRAGHWLLDLYAVARQRLRACGVERVSGGEFCTYSDAEQFFSFRRARTSARMAALIWLT